jgi:hypothetical protein
MDAQLKNTSHITCNDSCIHPWCGCQPERELAPFAECYGFLTAALEGDRFLP